MGGALSEPSTLVDLQDSIRDLYYCNDKSQLDCILHGLGSFGISFNRVIQGLQHVDDACVMSKLLCHDCIFHIIQKIWPPDVGITLEECGPSVRFLSCLLLARDHYIEVHPYNPNVGFALDCTPAQHVARLGLYCGEEIHDFEYFKQYFLGEILRYNQLVDGDDTLAFFHLGLILREIDKLGWPCIFVIKCLKGIPRRHGTAFIRACRTVGRALHKATIKQLFGDSNLLHSHLLRHRSIAEYLVYCSSMGSPWKTGGQSPGKGNQGKAGKGYQGKNFDWSWANQPSNRNSGNQNAGSGAIGSILGWVTSQMQASEETKRRSEMQEAIATTMAQMTGIDLQNIEKDKERKQRKEGKSSGSYVQGGLKTVKRMLGLNNDDSSSSEDSSSSSKKKKKKKLAKREKKSSGSRKRPKSDSSDSEPDWLRNLRKEAKEKEKDKEKEKEKDKEKKRSRKEKGKASGSTPGPRLLPEEYAGPADEDQKSALTWEQKVQIRAKLNVGDKVTDEQLKTEEWDAHVSAAARQQDLKALASACQANGNGSKMEILVRIVDWYKGGN